MFQLSRFNGFFIRTIIRNPGILSRIPKQRIATSSNWQDSVQSIRRYDGDYTVPYGRLTPQQRDDYGEHGYILIKNLVSKDKLQKYKDRFMAVCNGAKKSKGAMLVRDVSTLSETNLKPQHVIKMQGFHYDPVLSEYSTLPEIVENLKSIVGPNIMMFNSMVITKPPDQGRGTTRHPMHQDFFYNPCRPVNRGVGVWTAMEHVHRGNGCLAVVPGSHKLGLMDHTYPDWEGGVNKNYFAIRDYDPETDERIHVEMEEGDTLFFHLQLIHGSGLNTTDTDRRAISCHYLSADSEFLDVKGKLQETYEKELQKIVARRRGVSVESARDVKLMDLYRYKSHVIKGQKLEPYDEDFNNRQHGFHGL